jgi:hypothetical protein
MSKSSGFFEGGLVQGLNERDDSAVLRDSGSVQGCKVFKQYRVEPALTDSVYRLP